MGMMNNPHYRVMIHAAQHDNSLAMRFEHPTKSGSEQGGWMEREIGVVSGSGGSQPGDADSGANIKKALDEAALPTYSLEEVGDNLLLCLLACCLGSYKVPMGTSAKPPCPLSPY